MELEAGKEKTFKSKILKERVSKQEVLIYVIHLNLILSLVMLK